MKAVVTNKSAPKELEALAQRFRDEGIHARNAGQPEAACPYSISKALTAVEVRVQVRARAWWMEGYRLAGEERDGPAKAKKAKPTAKPTAKPKRKGRR
jgi:hypothetical protein